MKAKYRIVASFLLVFAVASALLLSVGAEAGEGYDFSHSGSPENTVMQSDEILEAYLGVEISEHEREFLRKFADIELVYSSVISTDKVKTEYNAEREELTVTASPYEYTSGGRSLIWNAVSVEHLGVTYPYTSGQELVINSVAAPEQDARIKVKYSAEAKITEDDLNILVNLMYETAEYLVKYENYEAELVLYQEYLHSKRLYDDALLKYNAYLSDKADYEAQLYAYDNFEKAFSEYNLAYAKYLEYLASLEAMSEEIEVYESYLSKLNTVKAHLKIIDTLKTPMVDGRSVYAAVMGSTVDSVVENKSVFTSSPFNADPKVIDMAAEATDGLRTLMEEYFSKKTEEEKYNYYIINYSSFCSNLYELTAALDELYKNDRIRAVLDYEGKEKKYLILVAQLALLTDCIIDGDVKDLVGNVAYNDNWKIGNKTIKSILENKTYLTDTDSAAPLSDGFPQAVAMPELPKEVTEPVRPVRPQKPIPPAEVQNPGAIPTEVGEPAEPIASDKVKLIVPQLSNDEIVLLIKQYKELSVTKRQKAVQPFVLCLEAKVIRSLNPTDLKVSFYQALPLTDENLLCSVTVEKGTPAVFEGSIPEKQSNSEFDYVFSGWQTAEGGSVSLLCVENELRLIPVFSSVRRSYDITWRVGDREYVSSVEYGEIPTWPGECPLVLADAGDYMYVFTGWNITPYAVEGEATYEAEFDKQYILPLANGGASLTDDGSVITASTGAAENKIFEIGALIDRAAGNRAINLKTIHGEVCFSYSEVLRLKEAGVETITLNVLNRGNVSYNYGFTLQDRHYRRTGDGIKAQVKLPCSIAPNDAMVLYAVKDGQREYKGFILENGSIGFTASAAEAYTLALEYVLSAHSTELVDIRLSKEIAAPGDTVSIVLNLGKGVIVDRIIVTSDSGEQLSLIGGKSFIMPASDVDVAAVVRLGYYTVTFTSDGKTVSTQRVQYGGMPTVPSDPEKHSDKKYSYEFIGWSPKLSEVNGDTVYSAVYKKTLLPTKEIPNGLIVSEKVKKLLIAAIAFLSAIALALVCAIVLIVRRITRKRKNKLSFAQNQGGAGELKNAIRNKRDKR